MDGSYVVWDLDAVGKQFLTLLSCTSSLVVSGFPL
jgi:hypothetical protein